MTSTPGSERDASPDTESPDPLVVAVDFTADTLRIALAEPGGELRHRETFALPPLPDEDAWSWEVGGRISTAFANEGSRCFAVAIGIACPGAVDPVTGRILESRGQDEWSGLSVVDALRRHINAPLVALDRTRAALRGEASAGAAAGFHDVLYVDLGGEPAAAIMVSGRIVNGGNHRAGWLPALMAIDPTATPDDGTIQAITEVLTDAAALLDPSAIVIEGDETLVSLVGPVLQGVVERVIPGIHVLRGALGDNAALAGALDAASTVAYEGERTVDDEEEV